MPTEQKEARAHEQPLLALQAEPAEESPLLSQQQEQPLSPQLQPALPQLPQSSSPGPQLHESEEQKGGDAGADALCSASVTTDAYDLVSCAGCSSFPLDQATAELKSFQIAFAGPGVSFESRVSSLRAQYAVPAGVQS